MEIFIELEIPVQVQTLTAILKLLHICELYLVQMLLYCGVFAPCGSCWSAKASKNATAQQQWSAAKPHLVSPPFPSLPSAPFVARLRSKRWIAQPWGITWLPRCHVQQYTTLCSPTCQTLAFIGETVYTRVATEFKAVRNGEFTTSSQSVIKELSVWVQKTYSVKRRFTRNIWSVRLL
jgi:hypothetical protein